MTCEIGVQADGYGRVGDSGGGGGANTLTCEIGVQTDGYGRVGDSGRGTNAQVPDCPSSHYSIQHGLHRCGTSLVHKK